MVGEKQRLIADGFDQAKAELDVVWRVKDVVCQVAADDPAIWWLTARALAAAERPAVQVAPRNRHGRLKRV